MTRTCGSCQLCCRLLPMIENGGRTRQAMLAMIEAGVATFEEFKGMEPDIQKAAGVRCLHQRHGKGCAIYARRPFACRAWSCRWLVEDDTEGMSRPDHSHYVIDIMPDYVTVVNHETGARTTIPVVQIWVDPKYPDAHRDPKLRSYLERRGATEGMAALIRYNNRDGFTIFPPALAEDGQWHEVSGGMIDAGHEPLPMTAVFGE